MTPLRYRCALITALLLGGAGLVALPQRASAEAAFKGGLKSAIGDVADLIETGVDKNVPRGEMRRLDDALHELIRALDDRHSGGGRFGDGMHQKGQRQNEHDRHGTFSGGLKSATRDVAGLIGRAAERGMPRSEMRDLDRALRDLVRVLDDRSRSQGRVAQGARHLNQTSTTATATNPAGTSNPVGRRVGKTAAGSAKTGPKNNGTASANAKNATGAQAPASVKNKAGNTGAGNLAETKSEPGQFAHHKEHHHHHHHPMDANKGNGTGNLVGNKAGRNGSTNLTAAKNGSVHDQPAHHPGHLVGAKANTKNGTNQLASKSATPGATQPMGLAAGKATSKTGANGGGAGVAKNSPISQNQKGTAHHTANAGSTRMSPVNMVGNMAGSKQANKNGQAANWMGHAKTGPANQAAFKHGPTHGTMPAITKHSPSNVNAGHRK